VRKDLHPAIIELLAKTIAQVHTGAGLFQKAGEFPMQTDPEFPMAETARDFYKNGPNPNVAQTKSSQAFGIMWN
jgi:hypothetical protein